MAVLIWSPPLLIFIIVIAGYWFNRDRLSEIASSVPQARPPRPAQQDALWEYGRPPAADRRIGPLSSHQGPASPPSGRYSENEELLGALPTRYVDVASVTKKASATVLIICCFSLVTFWSTSFAVIHPIIGVLVAASSIIFYIMGELLQREPIQ
jgi:hypothetical protein